MARLLFAGYFGCGNLGDDAILLGTIHALEAHGHDPTILSGSPDESFRLYGLPSVPRRDMNAVRKAIAACDALVFPGGSVFQDVTSVRSVYYYCQLVQMAKKAGKKVALVGQGVGPLERFLGRRWAASAFADADVVVVRDPGSATALTKLGITRSVRVSADPAFLLPDVVAVEGEQSFKVGDMRVVGLAPRPLGRQTKAVTELFGGMARLLFQSNWMPVLLAMDREADGPVIDAISKQQGGKIPDLRKLHTPMQVQQRMSRMDAVVAMRLHAGILAATVGVPPYMVSYDPKVAAFAKLLELQTAPTVETMTAQRLFESFMSFQKDREKHVRTLERRRQELTKLAEVNVEAILECVRGR